MRRNGFGPALDRAQPFIGTSLPLPPPIGDRGGIEPLAPHDGTDCAWNARSAINLAKNAQLLPGGKFAPIVDGQII